MSKAAFDGDAPGGQDPVGLLLGGSEPAGAGGLKAGDDHGIAPVIGQGAEVGSTQAGQDAVAAGGGDAVGAAGPGRRHPHQTAPLVGQREDVQAVPAMLAGVVRAVRLSGTALGGDEGAVDQDASPPRRAIFFRARSRRGAFAASRWISSSRQRRMVVAEMSLPPAMSARR